MTTPTPEKPFNIVHEHHYDPATLRAILAGEAMAALITHNGGDDATEATARRRADRLLEELARTSPAPEPVPEPSPTIADPEYVWCKPANEPAPAIVWRKPGEPGRVEGRPYLRGGTTLVDSEGRSKSTDDVRTGEKPMNTYTPKVVSMGEPWMMKDPNGGWVSLVDHQEALRQANADPNDIPLNTPPPEKVDHYKLVPVAEWDKLHDDLAALRRLAVDHHAEAAKLRAALEQARAQLADANRAKADAQASMNMYHDAWLRELGGKLIPKTHRIDALVLTTQLLVKDRDVLAAEVRAWRKWKSEYHAAALTESVTAARLPDARAATDASGALDRASK